jgi:hypothetical protein
MTGFSPEGVGKALVGLRQLERELTPADWTPESLFGQSSSMADLFGVMLRVPQLAETLRAVGGTGTGNRHIAEITQAWVSGKSIQDIAKAYFQEDENETKAITNACRAIYRNLVLAGTWGLSSLSRLSGIDFESLSESERRRINAIPAMIYHGVHSEEAVLMRMNSVPRSVAEKLAEEFRASSRKDTDHVSTQEARQFLKNLDSSGWGRVRPEGAHLSGADYKSIWELLSGEQR